MRTQTTAPTIPALHNLIELDLSGPPAGVPADEEATTETEVDPRILAESAVPMSTWDVQVSAGEACTDLIRDERAALAPFLQVTDEGQFFADGTALADVGHAALESYDRAFKALPPASTALADFKATIEAEHREDHARDLVDMRLNVAGRLASTDLIADTGAGLALGHVAWRQLSEIAGGPNVNRGLASRTHAKRRIRTRDCTGGGREAFGIVSTDPQRGYAVFDGPQVADAMAAGMRDAGVLQGAKMTLTYDRETTRYDIRAVVQAPIDVPAFRGVGRIHQLFARVTSSDDGMSSIRGGLGALRIRCLNATLVKTNGTTWTKRHVGDMTEIRRLVTGLVSQFGEAAASVQAVWSRAAAHHYLDTDGSQLSVKEALTRLVAHGHLPTVGASESEAVDRFMSAWREEESPSSAAGILMAVQRAAHESTWSTKWGTADLEEAASKLLYQPVWQLDAIEA